MVTASVLKGFEPFKGLNDGELAKIAELCSEVSLTKDERIFAEGTRATHLHLLRSGKVDVVIWVGEPWNKDITVHQARPGELFGWSGVVAPYTYTASAECVEAGEEISIRGSGLLDLFDKNPRMAYAVMRNLSAQISARLRETRQKLSTEWLSTGTPGPTGSGPWGEPNRR
jgi:CRP/FNR family cyclic AMP-dependent transcriptional regulator